MDLEGLSKPMLGLLVGAFPTVAMLFSSWLFVNVEVKPHIEAVFQNFAAGLVLGAVAQELFPLMNENKSGSNFWGVCTGFMAGIILVYAVESVVDLIFGGYEEDEDDERRRTLSDEISDANSVASNASSEEGYHLQLINKRYGSSNWEIEAINRSGEAVNDPKHMGHLREHLLEIADAVGMIQVQKNSPFAYFHL
jgi:hypothetical protein